MVDIEQSHMTFPTKKLLNLDPKKRT